MPEPTPHAPPRSAPRRADPLIGRTLTHYRVDERLGGGGMGVVYRAHDLTLGRDVALKFLPPTLHADAGAREQLLQEARAASALDHAHVASVYEIGEAEDGRLFLAMAYYDGQTVEERIAEGPLPVEEAVDIVLQAGAGLARAHQAGIVHRDVKPGNLIVTADGVVKVLDFGIAQAEGDDDGAGQTAGSAPYMSPEQAQGLPTDARTDVWGLGVTLYEMLTGRAPFSGAFSTAILYSVLHEDPRPVEDLRADLPAPLGPVVAKALAKDPDDRYPTVDALLDDLRAVTAPPPTDTQEAGWLNGMLRKGRLRTVLAVAIPFMGLAAVWGLWPSGPSEQHLAVLPFTTVGDDAEAQALADGLLETITGRLSQLEQFDGALWVVSSSEVRPGMTLTDVREQLGATLAVGGTVQAEDGRVRLLVTLSDTETGRQLDSEQVDVGERSALAIQDQAVLQIAKMLSVEIEPQARDALVAGSTDDAEANALYLRGRGVLRDQQSMEDIERAGRLFRQAIDRDPDFALAHAALGQALWAGYGITGDTDQADSAIKHVRQALALDAGLAPVHVALAVIHTDRQEYGLAHEALDRALEVAPRSADAIRRRAIVFQEQGRFDEAEAAHLRSIALQPDYWRGYNSLGVFYYKAGRMDDAVDAYRQALNIAPSNVRVLNNLAVARWETGAFREAAAAFRRIMETNPDDPYADQNLATALFYQGEFAEAAELFGRAQARYPDDMEVSLFLGDAQWWAPGQRERARTSYRAGIEAAHRQLSVARSPDVLAALAVAHARLGARDSALFYLDAFVALRDPDEVDAIRAFGVGEVYEALGERESARRWIQSALDRDYGAVTLDHSPWLRSLRDAIRPARSTPPS